jgi:hypothetical protein
VADGVDAAVHGMEPSALEVVADDVTTELERIEPASGHDPVLARREGGHRGGGIARVTLCRIIRLNVTCVSHASIVTAPASRFSMRSHRFCAGFVAELSAGARDR